MPVKILITGDNREEIADDLKAISLLGGILPVQVILLGKKKKEIVDALKAVTLLKETRAEVKVFVMKGSRIKSIRPEFLEELLGVKVE